MKRLASLFIAARIYILATPAAFWYLGAASNQAVLAANGGKFPVMVNDAAFAHMGGCAESGMIDFVHCRMTDQTKLNWLADYINLKTHILSPGDLLISLGDRLGLFSSVIWITLAISDYSQSQRRKHESNLLA